MTISNENVKNLYTSNGAQTVFAFGFKIFSTDQLRVVVTNQTTGAETLLALTTDYTVTGVGLDAGGSITLVAAQTTGRLISIFRYPTLTQIDAFRNQPIFRPNDNERAFDLARMVDTRLADEIARCIKAPEGEAVTSTTLRLPIAALRAAKYLGFDGAGDLSMLTGGGGGGGGATDLNGLTDVAISSAVAGDILRHNGSLWIDDVLVAGDIPNLDTAKITTGTFATARIADDAVTYAKLQSISATSRFLGRISGGAGDAEELTGTQATSLLDLFATGSTTKGLVPGSNGLSTANFLRADGAWGVPAGGSADGLGSDGDKGDVTVGGTGTTLTIDANAVLYSKMQDIGTNQRLIGLSTGAPSDPVELGISSVLDWIGSTRGQLIKRGVSTWDALAVGGNLTYLCSNGTDPSWSTIDLSLGGIVGDLPYSKLAQGSALSVLGVTGASPADVASIVGAANQVLVVNSGATALAFGTVATAGIADDAVTYAKIQQVTGNRLLGKIGSTGDAQEISLTAPLAFSGSNLIFDLTASLTMTGLWAFTVNTANPDEIICTNGGAGTLGIAIDGDFRFERGALDGVLTVEALSSAGKTWTLPNLSGVVTVLGNAVTGTGSIVLDDSPFFTGHVTVDNQKELRLAELTANGVLYVGFRAAAQTTASYTLTYPAAGSPGAGQILQSDGSNNLSWIATPAGGASPLTTKGDLFTFSTVSARLPVGTNGQVLSSDSAETTGLKWVASTGSVPTGTGFYHVTSGAMDAASKLIDTADINAAQVTFAKIQNADAFSILGRAVTGAGVLDEIAVGTNTVLGRVGADIVAATLVNAQIATNTIDATKQAQMATNTIKGNNTGGPSNELDLTVGQLNTMINSTVAPTFANVSGKPDTLSGYGITDGVSAFTVQTGISTAGTVQSDATVLNAGNSADFLVHEVTTVGSSAEGVRLNSATTASSRSVIVNKTATAFNIYPEVSGTIDGGSANAAIICGPNQSILMTCKDTSGNWFSTRAAAYSATNPGALGTAAPGTSQLSARADHIHPAADLSGAQATGILAAGRFPALTGDVTTSAGALAATIANDAVTYAKMQDVSATDRILGRSTAGAGNVEEITCTGFGRSLIDDANNTDARATLGVVIGTNVQAFDATLTSFANYNTNGLLTQTAADTFVGRTITGTAAEITVANGDGVSANPTLSLPTALTFTGKTVTGGTYSGVATTNTLDVQGALVLSGDISPAQITANQNDYAPTSFSTSTTLRLNTDASRNITGLAGGADGRTVAIINVGSFDIVLTDQDAASTAANRFKFGASLTLAASSGCILRYDLTDSRWYKVAVAVAGGGGGYTDEQAQDAIGAMIADTSTIDLVYTDGTPSLTAAVIDGSITYAKMVNATAASVLVGRGSASGAGVLQEVTVGSGITMAGTVLGFNSSSLTAEPAVSALTDSIAFYDTSATVMRKAEIWELCPTYNMRKYIGFSEEFWTSNSSQWEGNLTVTSSGVGATQQGGTGAAPNTMGIATCDTGTTSTGRTGIATELLTLIRPGAGTIRFLTRVAPGFNISTSGERYTIYCGLGDSMAGDSTDFIGFKYSDNINGGSWEASCRSNGGAFTVINSAVAAASDTFATLEAEVNADATSVEFWINGTSIGTIVANIPAGTGREVGFIPLLVVKSVNAADRYGSIDACSLLIELTTPR